MHETIVGSRASLPASVGLIGRKVGMTRLFNEDGQSVPVTVVDVSGNRVTQIISGQGYFSVEVAAGTRRVSRLSKSLIGHLAKAGVGSAQIIAQFKVSAQGVDALSVGLGLDVVKIFTEGQKVDVSGKTIGRGFSGVIRRHNFSSNRASHGNSVSHNKPGSISMAQDPGRVFPEKKLPGQFGSVNRTVQNLEIVRLDAERQLLFVKGAVPGCDGGWVFVRPAVKFSGSGGVSHGA